MSALLTYELNGVRLDHEADKDHEFEKLVVFVVLQRPDVPEIAAKLKMLTGKYQMSGISKFVASLKDVLTPFDSED